MPAHTVKNNNNLSFGGRILLVNEHHIKISIHIYSSSLKRHKVVLRKPCSLILKLVG